MEAYRSEFRELNEMRADVAAMRSDLAAMRASIARIDAKLEEGCADLIKWYYVSSISTVAIFAALTSLAP